MTTTGPPRRIGRPPRRIAGRGGAAESRFGAPADGLQGLDRGPRRALSTGIRRALIGDGLRADPFVLSTRYAMFAS
jgi:hypothetical protein